MVYKESEVARVMIGTLIIGSFVGAMLQKYLLGEDKIVYKTESATLQKALEVIQKQENGHISINWEEHPRYGKEHWTTFISGETKHGEIKVEFTYFEYGGTPVESLYKALAKIKDGGPECNCQ